MQRLFKMGVTSTMLNSVSRIIKNALIFTLLATVTGLMFNVHAPKAYAVTYSDGTLDTAFNSGGSSFDNTLDDIVFSVEVQPDGKIIVGGLFTSYNGTPANNIIRLNPDGSIDSTFNYGLGFDADVRKVIIQPDGKIIVGGLFTSYNGAPANGIIRLNPDGSVDTTFDYGSGFNGWVTTMALQPDGKLLVGGGYVSSGFTSYNGTPANKIIRLNPDGSVDTSFVYGSGFSDDTTQVAIQPDGKIVVGGNFGSYNGTTAIGIIRLNSDGSIDTTFNTGSGILNFTDSFIDAILFQPDGRVLLGGWFTSYDGISTNYIVSLNPDGSIDNTFNTGSGFDSEVFSIAAQGDGKIIIGGNFSTYNGTPANGLIRLNLDGSVDTTFVISPSGYSSSNSIVAQADGTILVGGSFAYKPGTSWVSKLVRLTSPVAPIPLTPPDLQSASDKGTSDTDNLTTEHSPTFDLKCATGMETITLYIDGIAVGDAPCKGGIATFTVTSLLTDGDHTMQYAQKSSTTLESELSPELTVTIYTEAAPAPISTDTTTSSDTTLTDTTSNDATNLAATGEDSVAIAVIALGLSIVGIMLFRNSFKEGLE